MNDITQHKRDELISFSFKSLEETALQRPPGYMEMVLKHSKVFEGMIYMTPQDHQRIRNFYLHKTPMEPRMGEMAKNFATAMVTWATNGFPVASEDEVKKRNALCLNCNFWDAGAREGLGKCNHSKCGCTKIKWWLATEKCPIGKW